MNSAMTGGIAILIAYIVIASNLIFTLSDPMRVGLYALVIIIILFCQNEWLYRRFKRDFPNSTVTRWGRDKEQQP